MAEYCLSTVVYPGAEKYFEDFFGAINNIPEIAKSDLIVIKQGDVALPALSNIKVFEIDETKSIAEVRAFMFQSLLKLPSYECYIFSDIDDRLLPESFQKHSQALRTTDFSYGNINLYENDLIKAYDKRLFDISDVPERLNSISDVMSAHFTGLSALAMTREALENVPDTFPDGVTFIDYWLVCELLNAGMTGARAGCVLDYRLNLNSYDALHSSMEFDVLLMRLDQAIQTLEKVTASQPISHRLKTLYNLRNCLQNDPQSVLLAVSEIVPEWILWFQDIFLLADHFYQE